MHTKHAFLLIQYILIVAVYSVLPSINFDSIHDGSQTGKSFFFFYLIPPIVIIILLRLFLYRTKTFHLTLLDKLLLLYSVYILGNAYSQNVSFFSIRLLEFCGLVILYIWLRSSHYLSLVLCIISLIIGGSIQAIYGNLQLWGYLPSHHNVFKITGSFFNPGPYSGYLASVFVVALGVYFFRNIEPKSVLAPIKHVPSSNGFPIAEKKRKEGYATILINPSCGLIKDKK